MTKRWEYAETVGVERINDYARDGWRVVALPWRGDISVLMEREIPEPAAEPTPKAAPVEPDTPDTIDSLRERVAELERALACERGDASGAPEGWRRDDVKRSSHIGDDHPHAGFARSDEDCILSVLRGEPGSWHWFVFERPDFMQIGPARIIDRGVEVLALEAMRRCDAVRAGGGK